MHLHAHWDCSHGISTKSMLMASLRAMRQVEPSVALETRVAALAKHLSSVFSSLGVTQDLLNMQLDECKQDVGDIRLVALDHDTVKTIDDQGDFQGRFRDRLQGDGTMSLFATTTATTALTVFHDTRQYTADQALALEHVRCEVEFAVELVAILWCLDQLQIHSVSYTPLPVHAGELADNPQSRSIYQNMTVILTVADSVVSETAAILLKALSKDADNDRPPAMKFQSATKGSDRQGGAASSTITTLFLGTADIGDEAYASHKKATATSQASQAPQLWKTDNMILLEANIDDMTAEHIAFCMERLLHAGAADAWTTPIIMKKGRPAVTIHCLCHAEHCDKILKLVFEQSTTLGVRTQPIERACLRREIMQVQTEWSTASNHGRVDVKVGYLGDKVVSIKAEFDHCRTISMETGTPIQTVADQAKRKAQQQLEEELEVLVELVPDETI